MHCVQECLLKNKLEIVFSVAVALLLHEFVQIVSVAPFWATNIL